MAKTQKWPYLHNHLRYSPEIWFAASLGISTIHFTSRRIYFYYVFLRMRSYASDLQPKHNDGHIFTNIEVFTWNLECNFSRYIHNKYIIQAGGNIYLPPDKARQLCLCPHLSVCLCVTVTSISQERVIKTLSNSQDIIIRLVAQTD